MSNVLCIYENKIATVKILENQFNEMKRYLSGSNFSFRNVLNINKRILLENDILIMIRPNHKIFEKIAKKAQKNGLIIIYYTDDDLMNLPKGLPDIPWRKRGMYESLKYADVIMSPNRYLCEKYASLCGTVRKVILNTTVEKKEVNNYLDNYSRNKRLKFLYAASASHAVLFDNNIKPILANLDKKYGDEIEFAFIGVHPELNTSKYHFPITFYDFLPLNDYRNLVKSERFDIGLAPLNIDDFSKCKYFNKFIEYTMSGIVGVYTNTEPYTLIVEQGINGFLVDNQPQEWLKTLSYVIENRDIIGKCRKNAHDFLISKFNSKTISNELINQLPELLESHKERQSKSENFVMDKLYYSGSRFCDWIYKFFYYLKNGGVKKVIKVLKFHIKTSLRNNK